MKNRSSLLALALVAIALATAWPTPAPAVPKNIELPPDGLQLKPSALPGFEKAQAHCTACHSAEYMAYQPPTAARPYWDAMVKRMKGVFKAPVADADMPAIIDYLVKTYGNEQVAP
ncbi:cytochrome c, class I [Rhizobacter sp. SG703]|uniref:SorB family sulfite dehydrogenase c-type cytochrome subunit n=1 Tax=Rhizobacter sp. SG703 TaxID=2587140 RepID=UPI00144791EC|nr:cytochrome c, class I [Rhizobacter sp. SG703]NKI92104.1 cytochrome c5 [Rhizobacter sp. SG703]